MQARPTGQPVEKVRLDCIIRLLEIIEKEHNHKLLLFVKNLQELGTSPFPYIVLVFPCPMPNELLKGEHFILADLLKLLLRSLSQAEFVPEPLVRVDHLPLVA